MDEEEQGPPHALQTCTASKCPAMLSPAFPRCTDWLRQRESCTASTHRYSRLRMAYANNVAASQMEVCHMPTLAGSLDMLRGARRGMANSRLEGGL